MRTAVKSCARLSLKELVKFQASLELSDQVAVEATGNTRHFREAIKRLVSKVVVVNPSQFEVIRKSVKKTDRHDARTLALFLSKDMLPESRLKEPARRNSTPSAQTRDKLVQAAHDADQQASCAARGRRHQEQEEFIQQQQGLASLRWGELGMN